MLEIMPSPDEILDKLQGLLNVAEDAEAGAAVVLILVPDDVDLQVLLVKRAINPSDPWSGDMALPGGKRHGGDRSLRETAIRETMEETGIDLRGCRFLGTTDVASSNVASRMSVLPFVVACDEKPRVVLSGELSDNIWVPLRKLRASRNMARVREWEVPAYLVYGEVVWGLTHSIMESLFELLDKLTGAI